MRVRWKNNLSSRRGFTLIELLVVASIVMVSLTIALPAVVDIRMAARDKQCTNRLKQIGLALHNYHDVYGCFAPGWVSREPNGQGHPSTGWSASILPFVEHAPLYNQLNFLGGSIYESRRNTVQDRQTLHKLLTRGLDIYRCSAEPRMDVNPLRGGFGLSAFSGNYGSHPIPRWSESDGLPGQTSAEFKSRRASPDDQQFGADSRPNGIFSINSKVGLRDITDGSSNTIMVGERSVIGRGGLWPGPRSNYHESDIVSDASYASGLNLSETGFSSRHPGGVHILLCDGSVHFLGADIESAPDGGILQHLASRNGAEVVGEF